MGASINLQLIKSLKNEIPKLKLYECKDFLEMAQIIKSSKFFIGNQSIAYPMAEALKVPRLLEAEPLFPVVQPVGKMHMTFIINHILKSFLKY